MRPPFAYEREPYRRELASEVLHRGSDGERPFVVLADTVLFPEGGGQPADRGRLEGDSGGEATVLDVQKSADGIRHFLDRPLPVGGAVVRLDWERRFDHMQQHSAQHLLSAIAADRFGWVSTSFHLGAEICDVELDVTRLAAADLAALEEAACAEIRGARAIAARRVSACEYARLEGVRSRGLPDGHEGDIRLVEISGLDLATCGGTHVASTSELETLKLLGTESLRGGTRLYWAAGGRVRRRLGGHEARAGELRDLLGASDAEAPGLVRLRQEQLKEAIRRERALLDELADRTAEALASRSGAFVEGHLPERDPGFLQRVARHFVRVAPDRAVFLTTEGPKGGSFALGGNGESGIDLKSLGAEIAAALGGKGGGAGAVFQGSAPTLAARQAAIELLTRRLKQGEC